VASGDCDLILRGRGGRVDSDVYGPDGVLERPERDDIRERLSRYKHKRFWLTASVQRERLGYNVSAINGLIGIDIGGDISIAAVSGNMALTFSNFYAGVNALGGYFFFDANTQVSATGAGTLTANNGVDPAAVLQVTAPSSLTGFFGFISTSGSLTSVSLLRTSASGFPDADDVIVGTASSVPEPGTMVLFGAGLGLVVLRRARLRR
jgi:PEP-CTERM motif-containing protein